MSGAESSPDTDFDRRLFAAKLAALAEFAAGAGHEINNPLATIAGRVQLLLRDETDPERRQALCTIGGQAYRIRDMIGDAMLFARPPKPKPEPLDLAAELRRVLERMAGLAAERGCQFAVEADPSVPILADRTQLAVVISELVRNGLQALHEARATGGKAKQRTGPFFCPDPAAETTAKNMDLSPFHVRIAARAIRLDDRPFALFVVADDGAGLSEEEREHLFDPFYSGRPAGRGLGFGLPKAWRIVTQHGGTIDVASSPGGETRFEVRWPADRIG
ncbi:MAG: HAMP domain-containing sensor histidine kinase [Planctomycetales bacterium]